MKHISYPPNRVRILVNYYISLGANVRPVQQSIPKTASALRWRNEYVDECHRRIKENPEWGIHLAISRGPRPKIVVATTNSHATAEATTFALGFIERTMIEDIMRYIRTLAPRKTLWENQDKPLTPEARLVRKRYNDTINFARNMQSGLNINDPDGRALWDELESFLIRF